MGGIGLNSHYLRKLRLSVPSSTAVCRVKRRQLSVTCTRLLLAVKLRMLVPHAMLDSWDAEQVTRVYTHLFALVGACDWIPELSNIVDALLFLMCLLKSGAQSCFRRFQLSS